MHAVLFDLYETLVSELNVPVRRASSLATQLGVDEAAYKREWKSRRPEILLGHYTFQEALAQIRDKLGSRVDHAVLEQLHAERAAEKTAVLGKVEPEVLAAVAELRRRGVKLALVTNCLPEDVEGWEGSPLHSFFNVTVFSHAAGLMKPDPAIYIATCRELDVTPHHALFVGDGTDEVAGARDAGLEAVRALWFASKWPNTTIRADETGLWRVGEVLDLASGAPIQ